MNQKRQQQRFRLAVYVAILSFGFVFLVISFISQDDFWRNLLMNIGADLLGVALLFFIVNRFFGLDTDESSSERLESIVSTLERRVSLLNDRDEGRTKFPLEALLQETQQLDMLGYNLPNLLQDCYEPIVQHVQAGAHVRVLLIDPSSPARDLIYQNTAIYDFDGLSQRSIKYVQIIENRLRTALKKIKGSFQFRVLNWIPSCSVIIANRDQGAGKAKIEIYSLHYRIPFREGGLNFILDRAEHPQWFEYYANQFEQTWNKGVPYKSPA